MKLNSIEQMVDTKYLNMYKLKLTNKVGNEKEYFMVSRRKQKDLTCVTNKHNVSDGVMVVPVTECGEVIILKQYRPAINDFLYELPAGIVDKGETLEEAAVRELYEETGLRCKSLEIILKPSYSSVGITDETTAVVKVVVEGEISKEHLEEDEEIEVMKMKIEEAKKFVKENNFSIKGALAILGL